MSGNICFFIGHHDAPEGVFPALLAEVERHIVEYGVTEFVAGRYGAFDRMAAGAVRMVKAKYPGVMLTLLLPYHPSAYKPEQAVDFTDFDRVFYPEGLETVPRRYAIARANRTVAEQCDYLIAFLRHSVGNTAAVVDHARRHGAFCALL